MKKIDVNLSSSLLKKIKEGAKKTWQKHDKIIFSNKNDSLVIVLKSHLIIENIIDDVLINFNSNAKDIINKKFSEKVKILKYCSLINQYTYERLVTINSIRNQFAHNIKYIIKQKDIEPLIRNFDSNKKGNIKQLILGINHLVGYLSFLNYFTKYYPFVYTFTQKKDVFKKDKAFKKIQNELAQIASEINMEDWKI
jgi:hypothetical protein